MQGGSRLYEKFNTTLKGVHDFSFDDIPPQIRWNEAPDTERSSHLHSAVITLINVSVKQELLATTALIDYDRMCCELKMKD